MEISIRPYQPKDAPLLLEAAAESTAEVFPWLPWCHAGYSLTECEQWVSRCETARSEQSAYEFAIVDQSDRLLGGCGLNQLRTDNQFANLGYWVRTAGTRRGAATAAVRQVAEFAFRETALIRLEIVVAAENPASRRVAEKAGAVREGVLRDRLLLHGHVHDAVLYSIVRRDVRLQ